MHPQMKKFASKQTNGIMGHDPQYVVPFASHPTVTFFVGLYQRFRLDLFGVFFLNTILASIVYKCFGKKRSEKNNMKKNYLRILTKPGFLRTRPSL